MTELVMKDIHKIFGQKTVNENHVLKGIDLTIHQGDFITVIGGNGAGKSTLLNTIAGTLMVEQGTLTLNGKDITSKPAYKREKNISRVFQDALKGPASHLTIEKNLAIADRRGKSRGLSTAIKSDRRKLYKQELSKLNLGLENRLKTDMGLLSGGQRQAITLLMATMQLPEILLLDEHTAALDPSTRAMVMSLTDQINKEKHLTALMVTHDMQQAIDYGNRLIMMFDGQIVIDIQGEEKKNLTVPKLLDLFKEKSGEMVKDDALMLA